MTSRRGIPSHEDESLHILAGCFTPLVTIVGKTWDLHVRDILGTDLEENLRMIADSVATCKAAGREVFYDAEHFFDGYKANAEYALRTLQAAEKAGANCVILCDTNGGTMPEQVAERVRAIRQVVRCGIGIHTHNDCDLAVANTLAAIREGATQVQGTMNGIGERCGNVDLVSVVANLALKYGYQVLRPESLVHLTEASRYVYEVANMNFRNGQPFVGLSAFAHKGGMHTHAVAKNPVSYEHIDPGLVGNERRILVSELSGQSTILTKTAKYSIQHDKTLMQKILGQVQDLENVGYEFEAAEASFDILVKKAMGQYRPWFESLHYRVNIEVNRDGAPITEATVKIKVGDTVYHTAADGDGPVNALDGAISKALLPVFPALHDMHLMDYKVRVVNAREGTAARVRVVIECRDKTDVWGTVGVSENIIEASWLALSDAIEYKLFRDQERGSK
jgi:2-isopropylmalate synthase